MLRTILNATFEMKTYFNSMKCQIDFVKDDTSLKI